jgi:hypothetical protein
VSVGSSDNVYTTIGISRPSQRDMPTDVARCASVGEVDASSREPVFTSIDVFLYGLLL